MAELGHARRRGADEYVDDVRGAEATAKRIDGFQQPRRPAGARVARHDLAEADVARATVVALVGLAEVRHERAMSADRLLAERVHLAELAQRPGRRLDALRREHGLPQPVVTAADEQQAFGLEAVTAGAARLLLIVLERLRHARVDHVAHIRAIDAHAEGDGGHHDVGPLVDERLLVAAALLVGQPRVVAQRAQSASAQRGGELVHLAAADAIDDARLVPVPVDRRGHLRDAIGARPHAVDEIGTVERADEDQRVAQPKLGDDVVANLRRGGGRIGVDGQRGKHLAQDAQLPVFRPEVVAPLADAVRFVHGDEDRLRAPQPREKAVHHEALGRDVEQLHAAGVDRPQHGGTLGRVLAAVEHRRRYPGLAQPIDLVLHQRDQR